LAQASFLAPGNGTSTVTSIGVWIDPPVSSYTRAPTARSIKKNTEISKYAFAFPPLWDRKVAQSYGISLDSTGQNSGEQYVNRRNYKNRSAGFPALLLHRVAPKNYRWPPGLNRVQPNGGSPWANCGTGESNLSILRPLLQLPRCAYCASTSSSLSLAKIRCRR